MEMTSAFNTAMEALKDARSRIDQTMIELERMNAANNLLMHNVQTMRAAYETLATSVKDQGRAFETLAKKNGQQSHDPVPKFLTERRQDLEDLR